MRRMKVKPSKSQSLMGMIGGAIFVVIGFITAISTFGLFGALWTLVAFAITGYHAYNFFSDNGASTWEVDIEASRENAYLKEDFDTKLRKLNKLKEDGLITEEEFQDKRNELMSKDW